VRFRTEPGVILVVGARYDAADEFYALMAVAERGGTLPEPAYHLAVEA
jgi:hypothetical protein